MNHDGNEDTTIQVRIDQEVPSLGIATDGAIMIVILTTMADVTRRDLPCTNTDRGLTTEGERTGTVRSRLIQIGKGSDITLPMTATGTNSWKDRDIGRQKASTGVVDLYPRPQAQLQTP